MAFQEDCHAKLATLDGHEQELNLALLGELEELNLNQRVGVQGLEVALY